MFPYTTDAPQGGADAYSLNTFFIFRSFAMT